ncbi:flagellar export protein FliJ [Rhodoferax sp. U11-2br]|uniref:flagellar export protein FliJ n=1 Tax=Rhodoferax sp. U11-2br TaxID=2838878 RepID=UPI001BE6E4E4|nr:flagellar export protein FliJ [Rhodoferax sp. U11-2br]MBT3067591.1 flagellar export protein FliJ [Rhodoferax sp. U11-2br]
MSGQKTLLLAIDLATARRDEAQANLQNILHAQAHAQDQMQQLQQYAVETEQRWLQGAQISTTPEMLRHHYQFIGRLDQAIQMQEGVLASHAQRIEAARQLLLQAECRLGSFKQVLATRRLAIAKTRQRQEQKQMDEFASQQSQRQQRLQAENDT